MDTPFAAEAAFFVAAEGAGGIKLVVGIAPDHAAFERLRDREELRALVAPDAGGEAILGVVGTLDRLLGGAERGDRQDRPKDLLLRNPVGLRHVGEERGREPEAVVRQVALRLELVGALPLPDVYEAANFLQLLLRVDRPDVGVLVKRIAHPERRDAVPQLPGHLLRHALLDQQPRPRTADVPLVEVDAVHDALHGLVDGRVLEDDVGPLPPQLQREALLRPGELLLDVLADPGGAGKRNLVDVRVLHEGGAHLAGPLHDVDDAGRQARLLHHLGELEGREGRRLGGLQHDGVARGEGRGQLPRRHQERKVPGDDLATDAQRVGTARTRQGVLQLVGPSGVVEEVGRHERDVHIARLADRLAPIHRLQNRKLAGLLLDHPPDPVDVLRPLFSGQVAPVRLVRRPGGPDGLVNDGFVSEPHLCDRLLRGRIDRREVLVRVPERAVDERAVAIFQAHVIGGLRRGGVLPFVAEEQLASRIGGRL